MEGRSFPSLGDGSRAERTRKTTGHKGRARLVVVEVLGGSDGGTYDAAMFGWFRKRPASISPAPTINAPPDVEPFWILTDYMCGLVLCDGCKAETPGVSPFEANTDEQRYAQAVAMKEAGWKVAGLKALCPTCLNR